jgi:hypothetical protein
MVEMAIRLQIELFTVFGPQMMHYERFRARKNNDNGRFLQAVFAIFMKNNPELIQMSGEALKYFRSSWLFRVSIHLSFGPRITSSC